MRILSLHGTVVADVSQPRCSHNIPALTAQFFNTAAGIRFTGGPTISENAKCEHYSEALNEEVRIIKRTAIDGLSMAKTEIKMERCSAHISHWNFGRLAVSGVSARSIPLSMPLQ